MEDELIAGTERVDAPSGGFKIRGKKAVDQSARRPRPQVQGTPGADFAYPVAAAERSPIGDVSAGEETSL
jgi:hypothetical protein